MILSPKNKRLYLIFSSLAVKLSKPRPINKKRTPEPKKIIPYLIAVVILIDLFNFNIVRAVGSVHIFLTSIIPFLINCFYCFIYAEPMGLILSSEATPLYTELRIAIRYFNGKFFIFSSALPDIPTGWPNPVATYFRTNLLSSWIVSFPSWLTHWLFLFADVSHQEI